MGKRKRSKDSDKVEKLLKEVKKLVKKRRTISSSSSDDAPGSSPAHSPLRDSASDPETQDVIPSVATPPPLEVEDIAEDRQDLEPDILQLLGSDPTQHKLFGDNLHKDLAPRWSHILINGLPKDEKTDLLKEYLPAENCSYMKAPALNPEIKSALSEISVKKDLYSEQKQNQMSSCISAIGKALNSALSTKDVPQEIIKSLSDAGRLLCDTHYRESLSRRFAVTNSLNKQKREILKNTKIDEHLFGSNLSEYLKSNKVISTSASELRFNSKPQRALPTTSAHRHPAAALNARGAPRASAAEPRVYPCHTRRPPPPPPRDQRRAPASSRQRTTKYPARGR